jgi:hypothetical protein
MVSADLTSGSPSCSDLDCMRSFQKIGRSVDGVSDRPRLQAVSNFRVMTRVMNAVVTRILGALRDFTEGFTQVEALERRNRLLVNGMPPRRT